AFQRRRHRSGHGFGAGAGKAGAHLNRGEVHVGQIAHRQCAVPRNSEQENTHHDERGHDRPANENPGNIHRSAYSIAAYADRRIGPVGLPEHAHGIARDPFVRSQDGEAVRDQISIRSNGSVWSGGSLGSCRTASSLRSRLAMPLASRRLGTDKAAGSGNGRRPPPRFKAISQAETALKYSSLSPSAHNPRTSGDTRESRELSHKNVPVSRSSFNPRPRR